MSEQEDPRRCDLCAEAAIGFGHWPRGGVADLPLCTEHFAYGVSNYGPPAWWYPIDKAAE